MKSQIKSVLIPVDFSESSERALSVGIAIAKRQNADVILLHVLENITSFQPVEVLLPGISLVPDLNVLMEQKITNLALNISNETGIKASGKILLGHPFEQICILAREQQVSLIVIGTHGTSGIRRFFMGSDAYKIVKMAPCPVLTVPGKWDKKDFKRVLFPIRLIPGAIDKYFYARPIIEKNNSELFLLGLTDMKDSVNSKELILLMNKFKQKLHNDMVKFQTGYCHSEDFPSEVIKTAEFFDNDLVILTANLDIDWKTYFLGPFVQQVLNHSRVPVLSIKPSYKGEEKISSLKLAENWGRTLILSSTSENRKKARSG
jgi:nucleotide-binding universal stress UspA family protein